jgi:hypothetical protein
MKNPLYSVKSYFLDGKISPQRTHYCRFVHVCQLMFVFELAKLHLFEQKAKLKKLKVQNEVILKVFNPQVVSGKNSLKLPNFYIWFSVCSQKYIEG